MSVRPKVAIMSLVSVMALGLSACGNSPSPSSSEGASPAATTEAASENASETGESAAAVAPTNEATDTAASGEWNPLMGPEDKWDTPFDTYMQTDSLLKEKVTQVALNACLTKAGQTMAVPEVIYNEANAKAFKGHLKSLQYLTPEYAEVLGYHPPMAEGVNKEFQEFMVNGPEGATQEQKDALVKCLVGLTEETEALQVQAVQDFATNHEADFKKVKEGEDAVQQDPKWVEAVGKWTECMKPSGVEVLSDNPMDMPPVGEMIKFYNLDLGPSFGLPTEDEIKLAKLDAQCRIDSGFNEVSLELLKAFYEKDLKENEAVYSGFRDAVHKDHETMRQYLKDNG